MNIQFDSEEEQGQKFCLDDFCVYCGEPLPEVTDKNRKWVDDGFCTETHMNMFYAEDELANEPDLFDVDEEELKTLAREEMKTRTGEIPTFKGERP